MICGLIPVYSFPIVQNEPLMYSIQANPAILFDETGFYFN